ncbi:alanine racemase [Planctomicrobium sp. SH661]|uniref:alanine racemase n=1 Tax=Planctomicrobium sp. SH661 TaxID=3448124 RepID=UPI003F5B7726
MTSTFLPARESVESTPALVIDLGVAKKNSRRLREYAQSHRFNVRPHTKTHKSRDMARLQLADGAYGLTAAKVGEAEVLADDCSDLLIAYPAIDRARTSRIAQLAEKVTVRVAIDSEEGINSLGEAARSRGTTIGILIDVDAGFHRTGVQSPQAALTLAQRVMQWQPSLRLDGLFFYPGHIWSAASEQNEELAAVEAILSENIRVLKAAGLPVEIVSGGSTPALYQSHLIPSQTELRPGTYLYNDMNTMRAGFCGADDLAAAIICTVVSTTVPGKAILDGGTKTFTSDRNVKFPDSGHGLVLEYPDAKLARLSEEHGELDLSGSSRSPRVGERVTVIPNHICPCVNLQDQAWLQLENQNLEPLQIDSRGRLS